MVARDVVVILARINMLTRFNLGSIPSTASEYPGLKMKMVRSHHIDMIFFLLFFFSGDRGLLGAKIDGRYGTSRQSWRVQILCFCSLHSRGVTKYT